MARKLDPTHAVRPVGCWAPKNVAIAVGQTGQTKMLEALTVDALRTTRLPESVGAMYPKKRAIHLFVNNARYHHAKLVQTWLGPTAQSCRW